jgi:ATP-dependent Clp protease ATP-binding subunit ClpA
MLSHNLEETLRRSLALANARQHEYATLEHLLMALIDDEDAAAVLQSCAVDIDRLRVNLNEFLDHELASLAVEGVVDAKPTAGVQRVIQRAGIYVDSAGRNEVSGANVLVALFSERESHAVYFLQEQNMSRLDAVNYLSHGIDKAPAVAQHRCLGDRDAPDDWPMIQSSEARSCYGAGLERILQRALALAGARQDAYATLDHLLLALIDDHDVAALLRACAIEVDQLRSNLCDGLDHKGAAPGLETTTDPRPTLGLQRVLLDAALQVRRAQSDEATGANVLIALFAERGIRARHGRLDASYRVSLLCDDDLPMEFVVDVLRRCFGMAREDAARLMLHLHNDGVAVCGRFSYEIAETKVSEVVDYARRHHHPLRCTMEKD